MEHANNDPANARRKRLMQARARRDLLWSACLSWKEDDRIGHLAAYCTGLCDGDGKAGGTLAREAIWS